MASVFVNAGQARRDTRNNTIIHGEVTAIETAILANIDAGLLYANITSGTTMTDSNLYYYAYNGITTDPTRLDQINTVKNCFVDLEYGVNILTNAQTNVNITWNISW